MLGHCVNVLGGHELHEEDPSWCRSLQRPGGWSGLPGSTNHCLRPARTRHATDWPHRGSSAHKVNPSVYPYKSFGFPASPGVLFWMFVITWSVHSCIQNPLGLSGKRIIKTWKEGCFLTSWKVVGAVWERGDGWVQPDRTADVNWVSQRWKEHFKELHKLLKALLKFSSVWHGGWWLTWGWKECLCFN